MPAFDSFRAARWVRTLNLVLQAVLFLTFFGGLNYVARNHAWRFDLTQHRRFSLSPETVSYLKALAQPVQIVVTLSENNDSPEVRGLLHEYVHATETNAVGRITTEFIDVYQDRRKAEELGIEQPNVLVLRSGDKRRAVTIDELYQVKNRVRQAFRGEQVVTDAILDVSRPARQRIYFLVGHGELQPNDVDPARGLSVLRDELRVRNFAVNTIELSTTRKIPADVALLVAIAPQAAYPPAEQELLRQYLSVNAGRLILLLPPGRSVAWLGLDELLLDWGVLVDNDVVVDTDPHSITDDLDLIVRAFDEKHPVTQTLVNNDFALRFGYTRTVRPDPGRSSATGLTVVPIAATSTTAWGEVAYSRPPPVRDASDIRPLKGIPPEDRLAVAVASERVSVRDNLPFSVRGGRLVVFGAGDFVSNQRIGYLGNMPVFLGAVNWTVDREQQINVAPRPIQRFQLALSSGDFMKLRYALLLGLPGATLLMGLIVYWTRRT
ncbi:MAG: GldG family protein [Opitutaceae bacterium]|nr:GldG family protein [Opitutaceae bacterium]